MRALFVLVCPPTINILAENIFNAADFILTPLIPTTLSVHAYEQMLAFFKESKYAPERLYGFFSMVERRKKMHREITETIQSSFARVFRSTIPYLSVIEQMGITREPVAALSRKSSAARAYQDLWSEIQEVVLDKKK